jgi:hypothetical protein
MKLQFLMQKIIEDLKVIPSVLHEPTNKYLVSMEDVQTVFNRWLEAMETEDTLKLSEQRLQDILNKKERLTAKEFNEAYELIMLIHMPLIQGYNDVMAVRLRDVDFYRLKNKFLGLPLDSGLDEFNQKVEELEEIERRKQEQEKALKAEKARRTREANKRKKEAEKAEIAEMVRQSMEQDKE